VKINMIKQRGGLLAPASDLEEHRMMRFKTGECYPVELKLTRNSAFHGKVFAFFTYCYKYYCGTTRNEHYDESKQFDFFRSELTCLAGYKDVYYRMDGSVRVEAQSISYAKMDQETFEQFYTALINAACKHVFANNIDDQTYNKLLSFF